MKRKIFLPLKLLIVLLLAASLGADSGQAQEGKFDVRILHPSDGDEVGRETTVNGTASIPGGNYLWVLARRHDFTSLWWPQREARIDPKTYEWKTTAVFGGPQDIGSEFDIGVITVTAEGHRNLMGYWTKAMETEKWPPIQIPATTSPPKIMRVKKVSH